MWRLLVLLRTLLHAWRIGWLALLLLVVLWQVPRLHVILVLLVHGQAMLVLLHGQALLLCLLLLLLHGWAPGLHLRVLSVRRRLQARQWERLLAKLHGCRRAICLPRVDAGWLLVLLLVRGVRGRRATNLAHSLLLLVGLLRWTLLLPLGRAMQRRC